MFTIMKKLKLAIVSPYPPGKGTLNEYAYHLVDKFVNKEDIAKLTVIAEKLDADLSYPQGEENSKLEFDPCWSFNSYTNLFSILKSVRKSGADIVLFNIHFLSFGDKKIPAALGLLLPFILKLMGVKTVVLLHNIIESVDLDAAGITKSKLLTKIFKFTGTVLTRFILSADLVAVTLSQYVDILREKYKADNVALIPHGTFDIPLKPEVRTKASEKTIMTFGKFGTYKKVEHLIDSVIGLRKRVDQKIKLVIAGTDNPNVKGYLESVQNKYHDVKDIIFTGYVEEEDVPDTFLDSDVVVFPYTSTTGSSGVLHQAGSFGRACVIPNIGDLKELIEEEGYTGEYFDPFDQTSLENAIYNLITDDKRRFLNAEQNYNAACGLPLDDIADWYLLHFSALTGNDQRKPGRQFNNKRKIEIEKRLTASLV
ncbi:MAG: glycosyltransferase [Saprospiraceae bacterium]|nr:glycosyltransferase [Saprospiraceae bacterium]